MFTKISILFVALTQLSACMILSDSKPREVLTFDHPAPSQEPVSYADLMCCYDCAV